MTETPDNLPIISEQARSTLEALTSAQQLEAWRVQYIGRKGIVPQLLRTVSELPLEERKRAGASANVLRQELEQLYEVKKNSLAPTRQADESAVGTMGQGVGHIHPLTITINRIISIFSALGFAVAEGPEVEEQTYNFDLLNIPKEHPARAESDTFYISNQTGSDGLPLILRTQTSPVQIRAVQDGNLRPPIRLISPGRVFRSEKTDATHESTFYQFEGLVISETASVAEFKGVTEQFYSAFFGKPVSARLRPSYFPFVEPGFEVDISCLFCGQQGCRVCKHTGWIEVMGAGMVHPTVLKNMNIDAEKYQGFAFGGAIDRLTMLRHGINDIRLFWSGDIRFLRQFS